VTKPVSVAGSHGHVDANGTPYSYCNGTFYREHEGDHEAIAPPIGATVPTLPNGAQSLTTGGITYYFEAKTYYRPFYSGSSVVYQVVAQPL